MVNAETVGDLDSAATVAFDHGAVEMLLLPERPVAGRGGVDRTTRQALVEWVQRNSQYRLAISDAGPLDGIPVADPFRDVDGLTAYAHIDASGRLRRSSFSTDGVEIQSSVGLALSQLREWIGEAK